MGFSFYPTEMSLLQLKTVSRIKNGFTLSFTKGPELFLYSFWLRTLIIRLIKNKLVT